MSLAAISTRVPAPAALLTQDQLAQSLQVSRHQIVRWRAIGLPTITLPGYKGDRCLRFDLADVLAWLKAASTTPATPPRPTPAAAVQPPNTRPQTRTRQGMSVRGGKLTFHPVP
jgi:hypothetical protein